MKTRHRPCSVQEKCSLNATVSLFNDHQAEKLIKFPLIFLRERKVESSSRKLIHVRGRFHDPVLDNVFALPFVSQFTFFLQMTPNELRSFSYTRFVNNSSFILRVASEDLLTNFNSYIIFA